MELTDSLKKNDHRTVEYSFHPHMHQPQGTSTNNNKFSTSPLKKRKMKSARSLKEVLLWPASARSHSSSPGSVSMEDLTPSSTAKLLPEAPHWPKGRCINCATLGEEDSCHRIIYLDERDAECLKGCVLTCTDEVDDCLLPMVCLFHFFSQAFILFLQKIDNKKDTIVKVYTPEDLGLLKIYLRPEVLACCSRDCYILEDRKNDKLASHSNILFILGYW